MTISVRVLGAIAGAGLGFVTSTTAQTLSQGPAACMIAPAIDSDFPDPSLLRIPSSGRAFAYATNIRGSGAGGLLNVPVSQAQGSGLTPWSPPIDALPHLPAWARGGFTWAPAVAHREGEPYRLYFTARYGYSGRPCIGVAVSESPEGPFKATSETKPLVCPLADGGAIDPSVFQDDDGAEYLLWKTDSNCCEGTPTIYIQALAPDGLALIGPDPGDAPWLLPSAKPLIQRDQAWEGGVIEAPTLRKHDGRYYLFYSAGDYASSGYAVGYAGAASLFGPYQKSTGPILSASGTGLSGPGGQDVFIGPDQETWIAFHAWREGRPNRYRALYFGRIDWASGEPRVVLNCAGPTASR
jgi:arabinan endo-1,5-alpha-L-arabinosidase